jgi:hypothetical protein
VYNGKNKGINKNYKFGKILSFSFMYTILTGIYSYFTRIDSTTISATHLLFSAIFIFTYFCIENKKWDFKNCSYILAFSVFLNLVKECSYTISFKTIQFTSVFVKLPNSILINIVSAIFVLILHAGILFAFYKKDFIEKKTLKTFSAHWEFLVFLIVCLGSVVCAKQYFIQQQNLGTAFFETFSYVLLFILPIHLGFYRIVSKYVGLQNKDNNHVINLQFFDWLLHHADRKFSVINTARGSLAALNKYEFVTSGFAKSLTALEMDSSCKGFSELLFSMFLTSMSVDIKNIDYKKDVFDVVEEALNYPKGCGIVKNHIEKMIKKSWLTVDCEIWDKEYFDACFSSVASLEKKAPSAQEFLFNMVRKNRVSLEELVSNKDAGKPTGRHAGLLSINSEGVLITGKSGVGKSEAAWELLEKGYRFVADDIVELRRIGNSIYGNACKESKGFMEARGLGIINVKGTFGSNAVKEVERVDLIVNLVKHKEHSNPDDDLIGEEISYAEVMGVLVPHVTITVRSEKSAANLIKIAALNNRRRFLGFVASEELFESLGIEATPKARPKIIEEKQVFTH